MTDFETHPVGTADLVARLRSIGSITAREAADRIAQLDAALTRANAAAAAAYKVAAKAVDEAHVFASGDTYDETAAKVIALGCAGKAIRALATPDQQSALDRLIADAVKPYVDALDAVLAWHDKDKHTAGKMTFERSSVFAKARAASKKGGV